MFGKENEDFKKLTATNLKFCFTLLSAFTADFIKVFPQVKSTFEKQTLRDQIMLNFHNKMVRGDRYSINEAWRSLE